jgi:hypothetical protein
MTVDPEPANEATPVSESRTVADTGTAAFPLAMLAASVDRERALDVLRAGFVEGRLTQAEHDARVTKVSAARTYGDLAELVADLPAGPLPAGPLGSVAQYPPAAAVINSAAVASLVCGLIELPTFGLSAFPAVILGNKARQQIRETGQRGEGLAVTGLILGWIALTIFFAAFAGLMIWLLLPPGPGAGGPIGS